MLFLQAPNLSTPPLPAKRPVSAQEKRVALRETNAFLGRLGRSGRTFEHVRRLDQPGSASISVTDERRTHMAIIAMSPRPWIVVYSDHAAIGRRMRNPLQGKRTLNDPSFWFRLAERAQRRLWPEMKLRRGWVDFRRHYDDDYRLEDRFRNTVSVHLTTPVLERKAQVCTLLFDDINRSLLRARSTLRAESTFPPSHGAYVPKGAPVMKPSEWSPVG